MLHVSAVGTGFIPVLAAALYLFCILSAVGRTEIKPALRRRSAASVLVSVVFRFAEGRPEDIYEDDDEGNEDGDHLRNVFLGLYPYLGEEALPRHYLDGTPEDDYRGDGHADIGSPRRQSQFLAEHER